MSAIINGVQETGPMGTWPAAEAPGDGVSLPAAVAYMSLNQIGTVTNTGGTATLGGILGDVANSSVAARLTTIQDTVSGIGTAGGAAISTDAATDNFAGGIAGVTSGTTKVGTQTNTYTATSALDGTAHIMTHAGQEVDIVYQFLCGGGTSPVSVVWTGILNPNNALATIQAWDHVTGAWEAVGAIAGQTSTTAWVVRNLALYGRHMGTSAAELGKVYIRIRAASAHNHILRTDQLYVNYSVTSRTVGYADGAVWVKATGEAASELFVNGTADNPCPWANAQTIATALGISRFRILNGETVTLTAATTGKSLIGRNWTLALGGQDIGGSYFEDANVSGTGVGTTEATFVDCAIGPSTTTGPAEFKRCGFNTPSGTPYAGGAAGQYVFVDCYSLVAGAGTPFFTFAGLGAATGINFRRWSGGSNVTLDAHCTMTMEVVTGGGQTVTTGGGAAEIRGICRAVTVATTGSSVTQIACVTGPIAISGDGGTVNIFGVAGLVTNTATGTTVTNRALSQETVASPLGGQLVKKTITYDGNLSYPAFTVTGLVAVRVVGYVTTALTNVADTTSVGIDGSTAGLIAATQGDAMQTVGAMWVDNGPSKLETFLTTWTLIGGGEDIVVTGDANILAGVVDLYCWWTPISAGATVVAV
jgi:hypothetical protein